MVGYYKESNIWDKNSKILSLEQTVYSKMSQSNTISSIEKLFILILIKKPKKLIIWIDEVDY